jgi:translation initiation factor 2-alpha kinase 3
MSPKYWVSSEDLSADSSLGGSQDESRDHTLDVGEEERREDGRLGTSTAEESIHRNTNNRTVARTRGANLTLPRLPNLQSQQHATLFYLSLIEGRCRTQAANTINASRSPGDYFPENHPEVLGLAQHIFAEMQHELRAAGIIEDLPTPALGDLRQTLSTFDSLLNNIAAQRTFNLAAQQQHNHRALPRFEASSFNSDIVSYNPSAFIRPRQAIMAPPQRQSSMLSVIFPKVQNTTVDKSIYVSDYEQLSVLGKGGFGKVYKARHLLDGAEYAIKKIVLTPSHLHRLIKENQLYKVTNEIKILARLDHHHITRYHHCWMESRPCSLPGEDDDESK